MRRAGGASLVLILLNLAACGGGSDGSAYRAPPPRAPAPVHGALPAAVSLDNDLHMVPVARDGRGCVQYRMSSPSRPELDALFYRTEAGDFSTIEEEAACT